MHIFAERCVSPLKRLTLLDFFLMSSSKEIKWDKFPCFSAAAYWVDFASGKVKLNREKRKGRRSWMLIGLAVSLGWWYINISWEDTGTGCPGMSHSPLEVLNYWLGWGFEQPHHVRLALLVGRVIELSVLLRFLLTQMFLLIPLRFSAFPNCFTFEPCLSCSMLFLFPFPLSPCENELSGQQCNSWKKWPVKPPGEPIIHLYLMLVDSLIRSRGVCLTCVRIFLANSHFHSNKCTLRAYVLLCSFVCIEKLSVCMQEPVNLLAFSACFCPCFLCQLSMLFSWWISQLFNLGYLGIVLLYAVYAVQ